MASNRKLVAVRKWEPVAGLVGTGQFAGENEKKDKHATMAVRSRCITAASVVMMGLGMSAVAIIIFLQVFLPDDVGVVCLTDGWNLTPTFELNVTGYGEPVTLAGFDCPGELDQCYAGTVQFSFAAGTKSCEYRYSGSYTEVVTLVKNMEKDFALYSIWNGRSQKDTSCAVLPQQFLCVVSYDVMLALILVAGFLTGIYLALLHLLLTSNCKCRQGSA